MYNHLFFYVQNIFVVFKWFLNDQRLLNDGLTLIKSYVCSANYAKFFIPNCRLKTKHFTRKRNFFITKVV